MNGPKPNGNNKNELFLNYGLYGIAGAQLAVSVVAGLLLGNYIDKKIGTSPWITMVGLILGFVGGLYNLIKIMNWHRKK